MLYEDFLSLTFGATRNGSAAATLAVEASVSPLASIQFAARVFANCGSDLLPFADAAVADGLAFIAFAGESDWMYRIYDESISWQSRAACVDTIFYVFRDCFARRCAAYASRPFSDPRPLDTTCFMWWNRFPSTGITRTSESTEAVVAHRLVEVMARCLSIDSVPCWWSSLHGLGHWYRFIESLVTSAIDRWIDSNAGLAADLKRYALAARVGNVQ